MDQPVTLPGSTAVSVLCAPLHTVTLQSSRLRPSASNYEASPVSRVFGPTVCAPTHAVTQDGPNSAPAS